MEYESLLDEILKFSLFCISSKETVEVGLPRGDGTDCHSFFEESNSEFSESWGDISSFSSCLRSWDKAAKEDEWVRYMFFVFDNMLLRVEETNISSDD